MEVCARVRLHVRLSLATDALLASQAARLRQLQEAQAALLITPAELPEAQFSAYYASLQEAGGDFYDVVRISEHIFGYVVADVSGHDIRTSFLTAALKALLQQNCAPIYQPQETLRMINRVLLQILPFGKYLTACYARLNRQTRTMSILSAGHPPALYIPQNGPARLIEVQGDILGAFAEVSHEQYDLKVAPGDRFFLYSDGLIERPAQRRTWTQCTAALLDVGASLRQAEMRTVAAELAQLMGVQAAAPTDDVVVLGIEV
jgi:sigma-B regulation protein RsbU (phosphoserine phosphatase)